MAALPSGVQYALSSETTYKNNKELVFVKLTDSALKAIEDFLRNNRDKLAKPKIQFLPGNEGKISIPAPVSNNGESTFHFSINSNAEMEGPQGSFECVRSAGQSRLEACGPMPRRMRVHANDDSYVATKDRMSKTIAAEQSKCTRVIKPNQTDIGRRVKVRSAYPHSNGPGAHAAERMERVGRQERSERAERHERPERVDRPERLDRPDRSERVERPAAPPTNRPQTVPPHLSQNQQHHPQPNSHQPQRPPPNPDLGRRPIKERLIQLLAMKPFKKPELYARLMSEGLKEKERIMVNKILPEIGTLKDNCYHLRRHLWNDVNEEWQFYTEEEKRMLKRRKPQNLTPPVSSDSANSLSPRASPGGKRSMGADDTAPTTKKQRISHYRRPSPPSSGYATTSSGERHASDNEDERTNDKAVNEQATSLMLNAYCRPLSSLPPAEREDDKRTAEEVKTKSVAPEPTVKKDNGYTLNYNTAKDLCRSPVKTNGFSRSSPPVEQNIIPVKDVTNAEALQNALLLSALDENMTDIDEFEREYPPITSHSTRRAYKKDFTSLYNVYQGMYANLERVASLFSQLEQQLKRAEPKSPHHRSIEQRIVEEYQRTQNDKSYQRERRLVNYLHRKLNHIKMMVHQYDQLRNLTPERVSAASTTQAY